jgi:hypothetical protein
MSQSATARPVPHDGRAQDRCRQQAHDRREAASGRERGVGVDDRHEEEQPIAEDADACVQDAVEPLRARVRHRQRPQVAGAGRDDEADRDLDHLDREEGVEIERLPDRDFAERACRRCRDHVADCPGERHDGRVDEPRGEEDQPARHRAGHAMPSPHAAVEDPGEPAQHHEGETGGGDDEQKILDGSKQQAELARAEAVEPFGRARSAFHVPAARPAMVSAASCVAVAMRRAADVDGGASASAPGSARRSSSAIRASRAESSRRISTSAARASAGSAGCARAGDTRRIDSTIHAARIPRMRAFWRICRITSRT